MPVNRTTSTGSTVTATPSTAPRTYAIKRGDTMSGIARQFGVSLQALVDANKAKYPSLATNAGVIQVGWQLAIPGAGTPATPTAPSAPKANDDVLLVGMNKDSAFEAQQLKTKASVTYLSDSFENDKVKATGLDGRPQVFDLSTAAGARAFADTLRLSPEQSAKVAEAIHGAGSDARDEIAQIAQVWARAEKGGTIPSRLVLSGHSVGDGVWGDDNGYLEMDSIARLAEAMPKAVRQVEDLHISGCYSGGQSALESWRGIFPNAKTIWAYTGSAPGSYSGATAHQGLWERATRGSKADLDREIAKATRKGENVAVWSLEHGYVDGSPPAPLADVRADLQRLGSDYGQFLSGARAVTDPQTGALRAYYNGLQRLLQHPELPAAERPALESRRDQSIRLIYYSRTVAPKFAETHADKIRQGFAAVGLPAPDFAKLSRADAMAQVAAFESKLAGLSPRPAAAQALLPLLTDGLRDLKSTVIPPGWV